MAYVNNLLTYTTKSTLAQPYAPLPAVTCDFGWYLEGSAAVCGILAPYTLVSYNSKGTIVGYKYPPPLVSDSRSDWGTVIMDYVTLLNTGITFDCYNTLNITTVVPGAGTYPLPVTIVPSGIQIVKHHWDFGNGLTAQGPVVNTTYTQATPDGACTLTVTDNLGRITSTTKRLNFISGNPLVGSYGRVVGT
jgi:hypothetical protein